MSRKKCVSFTSIGGLPTGKNPPYRIGVRAAGGGRGAIFPGAAMAGLFTALTHALWQLLRPLPVANFHHYTFQALPFPAAS